MAILLRTDGSIETFEPEGKYLSLEQLQKAVGGYIETVTIDNGNILIVNEEGKLQGLPYNAEATAVYHRIGRLNDVIVGDAVLAHISEMER